MMNNKDLTALLKKIREGTLNKEEKALLENWVLFGEFEERALSDSEIAAELSKVSGLLPLVEAKRKRLWPRYLGIAAAVAAIAFGIWFFFAPRHLDTTRRPELVSGSQDIAPGKNTAVLTVNGKQTQLSDAKAGIVINDDIKYNDGTKINPSLRGGTTWQSEPLTVITPKGGTYSIILQDGTKVWLNADSKLEVLPNFWNKTQRIVKLIGEGYFEVAKDKLRPFVVQSNGQNVTVLGTHFNISAYKGEGIRTTLQEGSVSVRHLGEAVTLKPNQQSLVTGGAGISVKEVDANEAIAWKNGLFAYKNASLETVMQQVARWYNVEVVYENPAVKEQTFSGRVSRYDNVSKILNAIEYTGAIKFKVTGKKITVL